jgi:hypothetical protein
MRRSASEVISDLEARIARLEKSAGHHELPKKVLAELEDLLSEDPFYENDMMDYWFTIEVNKAKEIGYREEMSSYSENFNVYEYEVEATLTLNDLIVDDATIEDRSARLYHFVYEGLHQADFTGVRVLKDAGFGVKKVGTPKLITRSGSPSKLEVPVKVVFVADGRSDFFLGRRANSHLASTRKVAGHIILAGTVNVRQLRRDLEDTFGIEDVEIDDGVLTFLMSTMDNQQVEKQVKSLAKKHDVKFEKGEFTDGLGMIYTKNASRRNRY